MIAIDCDGIYGVQLARARIGSFCHETCKAACCRKGKIVIDNTTLKRMLQHTSYCIKETNDVYSMRLEPGCPFLTAQHTCSIHKEQYRPTICDEFPIFIRGRTALIAGDCPAHAQGLLDQAISHLRRTGYIVRII